METPAASIRMGPPSSDSPLPSLLGVTIRRTLTVARVTLLIAGGMIVLYSAAFGLGGALFATTGTVVMPIFAVSAGLGGAIVFSNDRTKGVLEYLVAYGVSPRRILFNSLVAGIVVVSIILAAGITAGVSTSVLSGYRPTPFLAEVLLGYTIPMSYLTVSLMTTVGVFWTAFSSPRSGLNSPLGVLPLIGILPAAFALILVLAFPAHATGIVLGLELAIAVLLLSLLTRTDRLLPPDRMLSPA